ncbi:hypothetical protein V2G26_014590 [Clonostachys chloroleuca]
MRLDDNMEATAREEAPGDTAAGGRQLKSHSGPTKTWQRRRVNLVHLDSGSAIGDDLAHAGPDWLRLDWTAELGASVDPEAPVTIPGGDKVRKAWNQYSIHGGQCVGAAM